MHLPSKSTFFDPRILPEHQPTQTYNPQAIQTHYVERSTIGHGMVNSLHLFSSFKLKLC
jgi:hypothetical protein